VRQHRVGRLRGQTGTGKQDDERGEKRPKTKRAVDQG
jgi:hypothetical protein